MYLVNGKYTLNMFIFDIYTKQKIALVSSEISWKLFKSAQFDRYEPEYALGMLRSLYKTYIN